MTCASWDLDCQLNVCATDESVWSNINSTKGSINCPLVFSQTINQSPSGQFIYNPAGLLKAQTFTSIVFDQFLSKHAFTDDINNPSFDPFQFQIVNLCTDATLPGICEPALNSLCDDYSRSQVESSNILTSLCGCHVPPDQTITQYTLGTTPCLSGSSNCQSCIPGQVGCVSLPACDPLCRRSFVSQKADPSTGRFIGCPSTICAIDDVSVIGSNVTFNQTCSGCGGGGCICIISGINVTEVASSIGLGLNFNQYCGGDSVCITNGIGGPCPVINPADLPVPTFSSLPSWGIFTIVLVGLLILGIALWTNRK
jgi:hypothetical protein